MISSNHRRAQEFGISEWIEGFAGVFRRGMKRCIVLTDRSAVYASGRGLSFSATDFFISRTSGMSSSAKTAAIQ